ncbi:hypothetical protein GUJ93_ZPchr0005g15897 [Zizania palustris]|nr:hypothetical protein GUJ93_ZPchr0005g15897 [Zizania palustris]
MTLLVSDPTLLVWPVSPAATSSTSASTSSSSPPPRWWTQHASDHCCGHFGYQTSTPYTPHVSLLHGDLTDEEKEVARKKVEEMDKEICAMQFEISKLALYRTDTEDKSLESWELVET